MITRAALLIRKCLFGLAVYLVVLRFGTEMGLLL